jgi:hypothetical protein
MKQLLVYLLLLCCFSAAQAQANFKSDSLAYQVQRKKINAMLDIRKQKFGQYEESLSQHSGIFGLQTKKDIRRSNDILMDIIKTDEEIFAQLKILLDYRAFEQSQVQTRTKQVESHALAYMGTINKLRNQLDMLKKGTSEMMDHQRTIQKIMFGIIVLMFLSILFLISRKSSVKA